MPNNLNITNNTVENGYIYKELNNRMLRIEKNLKNLNNTLKQLSDDGISLEMLTQLMSDVNKKSDISYVDGHKNDSEVHVSSLEKTLWDQKYDLPTTGIPETDLELEVRRKLNLSTGSSSGGLLKYETLIGNNSAKFFNVRHNFNVTHVMVQVRDAITSEIVYVDIKIVDSNTIRVDFAQAPPINSYRVIVLA